MARRTKPTIEDELIDKLLEGREHSTALLGNDGLIGELKKRLAERMLSAEMDVHLDDDDQQAAGNHRNGYSQKSVTMVDDRVVLDIPRDRNGQFDPLLIPKYARRFPGFDDKIIALYARGMSTRDIQAHIEEIYGITVSRVWSRRSPRRSWMRPWPGRTGRSRRPTRSSTSMPCG